MSEAVSDSKEDTMGVVVGDQHEGDKEDVVLIPDKEGDHEIRKTLKVSCFSGVSLTLIGIIIIIITAFVWGTLYIPWFDTAAPILWIIIGIFMVTHGVIAYFEPPKMHSLEVIINGKQFAHNLPLKQIFLSGTNLFYGFTGIITMTTVGPCCEWPAWNIIGLTLSILTLSVALISTLNSFYKTSRMLKIPYFNLSETKLRQSAQTATELLKTQLEIFSKLLPLPSVESLTNLDQVMKQPRKITNKPVHVLCLIVAMIVCVVMFTAQLWDVATLDQGWNYYFGDPDNAFARDWVYGWRVSDRKIAILVSTPITFLLSTMLLLLIKENTVLRMFLSGIMCLMIGIFFFGFSLFSVQYIIMMGVQFSSLAEILVLVSLLPIPLLSSLFLALAYGNIVQMKEEKEAGSSSKTKICLLSISFILAILFLFVSLATMTSTNLVIRSCVQMHWNTTQSHSWDKECRENHPDNNRYNYNDYGYQRRDYELTTRTASKIKPEKCNGKQLDHEVQDVFVFFSISQVCLTEVVLFLSFFVFLTGRRITKKSLFLPGILLFASAISTIIAFFSGVVHYNISENDSLFLPFLCLNGINTFSALVIGFICIVIGGSLFISIMTVLSRIILSIVVFVFIILLTVLQAFLKLASHVNMRVQNTEEQPEGTTT